MLDQLEFLKTKKRELKLSHRYEIEINKPLGNVTELYGNRDFLSKWQRGLLSSEQVESKDGLLKYNLTFDLGRRKMKITETIIRNKLPEHFDELFEMKGVHHSVKNSFYSSGMQSTRWICEVEFQFSGLKNLIARFMRSGFERQTLMLMHNFKAFAEKR